LLALLSVPIASYAQQADGAAGIGQINFLLGEWMGEGGGAPGQGTGGFTFSPDLQNTVLVRKNYAEYAATQDKPAYRHDDLMVIYQSPGDSLRAIYFDNEGHVINYAVDVLKDKKTVIFVSPPSARAPRFRLTNTLIDSTTMSIQFEMTPPGKPDSFSTYITATAHRK
jgi:hypothetical protein